VAIVAASRKRVFGLFIPGTAMGAKGRLIVGIMIVCFKIVNELV
jgi:hypothetical protein